MVSTHVQPNTPLSLSTIRPTAVPFDFTLFTAVPVLFNMYTKIVT